MSNQNEVDPFYTDSLLVLNGVTKSVKQDLYLDIMESLKAKVNELDSENWAFDINSDTKNNSNNNNSSSSLVSCYNTLYSSHHSTIRHNL
ncbi:hypothetical protein CYY_003490 [Polysphondylium violaceum]|uniref:Uncharacterized protein n=1 Tax=Polysphondylium violaceum TaxID=133409 RepID=A0A8J4PXL1_9MYCE|nr:hypothetical protein CYY_003490 [Polysphondylium violaceum]